MAKKYRNSQNQQKNTLIILQNKVVDIKLRKITTQIKIMEVEIL